MKNIKLIIGSLLVSSFGLAFGGTLQLDFGKNKIYTGVEAPAKISDKVWNEISEVEKGGNLVFGDGVEAEGVIVDLGQGASGEEGFWANKVFTRGLDSFGKAVEKSILSNNLGGDWLFSRDGANLGVRVKGLEAGVYDVYVIVREANQLKRTYDVGVGVGDTSNIDDLNVTSVAKNVDAQSFVKGENYVLQRVSLQSEDDFITVIIDPTNENFGTVQGIQIVPVP